jgi:hypothetical protein
VKTKNQTKANSLRETQRSNMPECSVDVNGNAGILACRKRLPAFPFRLHSTRRIPESCRIFQAESCRIIQAAEANTPNGRSISPITVGRPINGSHSTSSTRLSTSPTASSRNESSTPNGRSVSPTAVARPLLSYGKNLELKRPEVKGLQKQPQSLEERGTTKKALAWSLQFEVREYEKDSPPHLLAPPKQLKEQRPTPEATEAANRTAYQRMVHTANRERARLRAANIAEICPHLPREASQA